MDIYTPAYLSRLVTRLRPVPTFFLDTFFREVITSDKEEIYFDVSDSRPRLAPFVSPLLPGKVVSDEGYSTKSFKPAYIKDKRVHHPLKAMKRLPGEDLWATMSPEQRMAAKLASDVQDQKDMLLRRLEVMASEAIIYGRQTIIGDGVNALVNFGRNSALSATLSGAAKWDHADKKDQSDDFEEWSQLLLEIGGSGAGIAVMDIKAWKLLKRDEGLKKLLSRDYKPGSDTNLNLAPRFRVEGAVYKGNIGDFEVWVYSLPYEDPETGQAAQAMPDNTVILSSRNVEGVRHYGAILDVETPRPTEQFVKSWVEQDPSVRYLLSQSAPLMVPYRVNATMTIKVA